MKNSKKQTIHNPHDKLLFNALKNHDVARDAMQAYLPKELLKEAELNSIKLYKTKLITPEFKEFQADIIYEVPLKNQSGLFLFHCEQQSKVEKNLPMRIWQYLLLVLMEYVENHPHKPLPIIYPIIIYTGEAPYTESTNFFDLFGENKVLAEKFLLREVQLVDVCRMRDKDIKKHHLFGLSEFAFKHKKDKNFEEVIKQLIPWVHDIEIQAEYVKIVLKYVVDVFPNGDYELLVKEIKNYLSEELEEQTMPTIAEQLREEGFQRAMTIAQQLKQQERQEGIQQGIQQGMRQVAIKLLADGIPIDIIARSTNLPKEVLDELKNSITIEIKV